MTYKVLVITAGKGGCCSAPPPLNAEVEKACNLMASQGYELVTAYPETVNVCQGCNNQNQRASFLIFAHA